MSSSTAGTESCSSAGHGAPLSQLRGTSPLPRSPPRSPHRPLQLPKSAAKESAPSPAQGAGGFEGTPPAPPQPREHRAGAAGAKKGVGEGGAPHGSVRPQPLAAHQQMALPGRRWELRPGLRVGGGRLLGWKGGKLGCREEIWDAGRVLGWKEATGMKGGHQDARKKTGMQGGCWGAGKKLGCREDTGVQGRKLGCREEKWDAGRLLECREDIGMQEDH